jgi:hypothetical protein
VAGSDEAGAQKALASLIAQQPERVDARLLLASLQMRDRRTLDALATLKPIRRVKPAQAPQFFQMLAMANYETGSRKESEAAARRWVEFARTPQEKATAERFLKMASGEQAPVSRLEPTMRRALREVPGEARSAEPPAAPAEPEAAPTLRRREEIPPKAPVSIPPSSRAEVRGVAVHVDCSGAVLKYAVKTDQGRKVFLLSDPGRIVLVGSGSGTIEMNCGPQSPRKIRVEHDPPPAGSTGVDGVLRVLEFLP